MLNNSVTLGWYGLMCEALRSFFWMSDLVPSDEFWGPRPGRIGSHTGYRQVIDDWRSSLQLCSDFPWPAYLTAPIARPTSELKCHNRRLVATFFLALCFKTMENLKATAIKTRAMMKRCTFGRLWCITPTQKPNKNDSTLKCNYGFAVYLGPHSEWLLSASLRVRKAMS